MAKKSNWSKVSSRGIHESSAYRDVHESQQLDRGSIREKQSMTGRTIWSIVLGVVVFLLAFVALTVVQTVFELVHLMIITMKVKIFVSLFAGLLATALLYEKLKKNLDAQNLMNDTSDINQHKDDQHIALPEEVQRKYDIFPDIGAQSNVQVSSMISHMMLTNDGLDKVRIAKRYDEDVIDEETGEVIEYEGSIIRDEHGKALLEKADMIDIDFGEKLFEASGVERNKKLRRRYNPSKIEYNIGGKNREKLKYDTVADLINGDWTLELYEPQRPTGAYITDSAPVNTMVLAITRAGKGQTYIEPVIDMWLREKAKNNMVVNDPKGELLVKFYVRAVVRGYQVIQFNLINSMKTDIYNPLGLAAEAAREGDGTKCATYVNNIADVFFPNDAGGSQDPVWNNAANNAFKRAAYGLIDYYLEEEREMRDIALEKGTNMKVLETQLDVMWGKVTLYNCYQFFVRLSSENMANPLQVLKKEQEQGKFDDPVRQNEFNVLFQAAEQRAFLWEDKPEMKMLDLFFNATDALPQNTMRRLISDANNSLKSMAGAEKMLASVYGIAITAMSFFVDPTISTLTSGTASQNTDLGGLSFPRRMGVRFDADFVKRNHLIGRQVKWDAFSDSSFKDNLGSEFEHDDIISREGWARYFFKGIFPNKTAYIRLRILNAETGMLIKTLYFKFVKDYQTSLNGRYFITDPITGKKIIKNGFLTELRPVKNKNGKVEYKSGSVVYNKEGLKETNQGTLEAYKRKVPAIISTMVRYSEKPKAIFLVTPPHLMKYAKLLLILIKQLVDLNFDQSYMTRADQKPFYKTRYMLDELGNLQSDGAGISGLETMLSIGLGQEQQFTLILQTLQQIRDVYGDSSDKIIQGNAQPLDAKIATPGGWIEMKDAKIGTEVLVPSGKQSIIDGVYPKGERKVFKILCENGAQTRACDEHLWDIIVED